MTKCNACNKVDVSIEERDGLVYCEACVKQGATNSTQKPSLLKIFEKPDSKELQKEIADSQKGIAPATIAQKPKTKYCQGCGNRIKAGDGQCMYCSDSTGTWQG
eukprot:gb/GEZN01014504.1/.p1 GENE.gb/GEZN01014504.1/~~gb/GEZN01014504.1/.p1  ORF type:complete len:104 (+),score=19.85 gb/GEZN01014504.1/:219-530(+)